MGISQENFQQGCKGLDSSARVGNFCSGFFISSGIVIPNRVSKEGIRIVTTSSGDKGKMAFDRVADSIAVIFTGTFTGLASTFPLFNRV